MSALDLAFGQRVRWQGQDATIIDIDWQRLHAVHVRIRIPTAQPRTRWVRASDPEDDDAPHG